VSATLIPQTLGVPGSVEETAVVVTAVENDTDGATSLMPVLLVVVLLLVAIVAAVVTTTRSATRDPHSGAQPTVLTAVSAGGNPATSNCMSAQAPFLGMFKPAAAWTEWVMDSGGAGRLVDQDSGVTTVTTAQRASSCTEVELPSESVESRS
jgi:hypothetical protein